MRAYRQSAVAPVAPLDDPPRRRRKDGRDDTALTVIERMAVLERQIETRGDIHTPEARAYRRYLRLLWRLPGAWSPRASVAAETPRAPYSPTPIRKDTIIWRRPHWGKPEPPMPVCLICGGPAAPGVRFAVAHGPKFVGCQTHKADAHAALFAYLRTKYPETTWTSAPGRRQPEGAGRA